MKRNESCTRGMRTKQLTDIMARSGRVSTPPARLMSSSAERLMPVLCVEARITLLCSAVIAARGASAGRKKKPWKSTDTPVFCTRT